MSINEVLLLHSLCGSFVLGRLEYLQQRPYELQRLNIYFLALYRKSWLTLGLDSKLHEDGHWFISAVALIPNLVAFSKCLLSY